MFVQIVDSDYSAMTNVTWVIRPPNEEIVAMEWPL